MGPALHRHVHFLPFNPSNLLKHELVSQKRSLSSESKPRTIFVPREATQPPLAAVSYPRGENYHGTHLNPLVFSTGHRNHSRNFKQKVI